MARLFEILRLTSVAVLLASAAGAAELVMERDDLIEVRPSIWVASGLRLPEPDLALSVVGPRNSDDGVRLLRLYSGQGGINGFDGVLYDNRDRGHSALDPDLFPSLTQLRYGDDLVAEGMDFGLAGRILMPAVVLGNSSTALERGAYQRSLPRLAMTDAFWRSVTPVLYTNNHVYVYPEHRDFDAEDRYPVNWPYMITSQGSSGSDRRFLSALALTLAAFSQDTFAFLREKNLVAPTLQMILRRNLDVVAGPEDYLSGAAHPAAFDGRMVRSGRMVAQAAEMRPDNVPPLVRLHVVEDEFSGNAGLGGLDERLLDTPAAIGRLWRNFAWEREMIVSAEDTVAPNDRSFTMEWRLLRGDPDRVTIEPLGPDGRTARIRVAWHDPWTETARGKRGTFERSLSRVDIGVFADNGVFLSAPSFISIAFPKHELRRYSDGPNGEERLLSIDYDARGRDTYFDPLLYWTAPWKDEARYDESGALLGWDRLETGGEASYFVPNDDTVPLYEIDRGRQLVPLMPRADK